MRKELVALGVLSAMFPLIQGLFTDPWPGVLEEWKDAGALVMGFVGGVLIALGIIEDRQ
jgi:fucose permease